ncbi:MAG: hypothetical protein JOZ37_12200, partial [Actinobacteria bacterium]|nr:hypothetical protein [Actinomycetota bacterium]
HPSQAATATTAPKAKHAAPHRKAFHYAAAKRPTAKPIHPFANFFDGFQDLAAAFVTALTAAIVGMVLAMVAAVFTIGLSIALLPWVILSAVLGVLFAGVFGWVGLIFAAIAIVIALVTGELLIIGLAALIVLLTAMAGLAGAALALLVIVCGATAWRQRSGVTAERQRTGAGPPPPPASDAREPLSAGRHRGPPTA